MQSTVYLTMHVFLCHSDDSLLAFGDLVHQGHTKIAAKLVCDIMYFYSPFLAMQVHTL